MCLYMCVCIYMIFIIYNTIIYMCNIYMCIYIHTYICIYIYTYILFQIIFPYQLLQNIEYSSLCYRVGPFRLFTLYMLILTSPFIHLPPFSFGNHSLFSMSVGLFSLQIGSFLYLFKDSSHK